MYRFLAVVLLASSATAVVAQQSPSLPAPVKKDVQCFLLFAAAGGGTEDEKIKQTATMGVAYYYGRLQASAPGLNLVDAVREELATLWGSAEAEKIGAACDAEISTLGAELMKFGQQLQASEH